ncbi:MAG: hypothetical protein ACTTJS_03390 [Wolinella sp.]
MMKLLQCASNGVLEVISVNKEYKSYTLDRDGANEVRIIGKVLKKRGGINAFKHLAIIFKCLFLNF